MGQSFMPSPPLTLAVHYHEPAHYQVNRTRAESL
jgi:hypothetical protein